ncbi:6849_t:CDS:2, partial [Acaulospora morrowiae]
LNLFSEYLASHRPGDGRLNLNYKVVGCLLDTQGVCGRLRSIGSYYLASHRPGGGRPLCKQ